MSIHRLFKLGRSVVLTIPKSMCEDLKVFCGDSVSVDIHDGALRVRPMEVRAVPPSPLSVTDTHLRRAIRRDDE
jgi:antitoxin component of MazEF toxin-antitoxin module